MKQLPYGLLRLAAHKFIWENSQCINQIFERYADLPSSRQFDCFALANAAETLLLIEYSYSLSVGRNYFILCHARSPSGINKKSVK